MWKVEQNNLNHIDMWENVILLNKNYSIAFVISKIIRIDAMFLANSTLNFCSGLFIMVIA